MPASVVEITRETFQQDVLDSKIPVVIDFGAPWCGPCKVLSPALQAVVQTRSDKIRITMLNVVDYPEYKAQFKIEAIPCFVLVVQGKEVGRIVEPTSVQNIISWLDAIVPGKTEE